MVIRELVKRTGITGKDVDDMRAYLARAGFGLPYVDAEMAHRRFGDRWTMDCLRAGHAHAARYAWKALTPPAPAEPGTLLFHLAERYNFFAVRGGRLHRGQVHHAPYELSLAQLTTWSEQPVEWDGFPLATLLKAVEPTSDARYVRFETVVRPEEMPGQRGAFQPWSSRWASKVQICGSCSASFQRTAK